MLNALKGRDMFHRVKSEPEKTQDASSNRVEEQQQDIEESIADASAEDNTHDEYETTSSPQKEEIMSEEQETNTPETQQTKPVDIPSQAYNSQAPAARAPYSGSTYGYGTAQTPTTSEVHGDERRLVIGRGITMSGEIEHCDTLLVEGTIEAALKGAQSLEISKSGTFYGTVEINEAMISGRFEGELTVNGRLTVAAGGVITGSISYKELQIEAGATIDGKLTPLKEGGASSKSSAPAKKKETGTKEAAALAKAREIKDQRPANSEGELFSAAAAE